MTLTELGVDPLGDLAEYTASNPSSVIATPLSTTSGSDFFGSNAPATKRLWAIADVHLSFEGNREQLERLNFYPNDGLIIVGDVGEGSQHLALAFMIAKEHFAKVWWVPGNHELYTSPTEKATGARGEAKYEECVHVARGYGVLTPEDPFEVWDGDGGPCIIAPIFTLYDYSFRPPQVSLEEAVEWAKADGVEATDEHLLHYEPYKSRSEWCTVLVDKFRNKLEEAQAAHPELPMIIANHWPLRQDLVYLKFIPRFSIWCGTTLTEDWHKQFNAKVVLSGHLHIRRTDWKDGTRFEECSLGYPRQWKEAMEQGADINDFLREVLPGPNAPAGGNAPTMWHNGRQSSTNPGELFAKKMPARASSLAERKSSRSPVSRSRSQSLVHGERKAARTAGNSSTLSAGHSNLSAHKEMSSTDLTKLVDMGIERKKAESALEAANGNVERATEFLFES